MTGRWTPWRAFLAQRGGHNSTWRLAPPATELTAARGRYLVGKPSGGTLAGTAGIALTDLETRVAGAHVHGVSDPGHTHGLATSIIAASVNAGAINTYSSNAASATGSNTTGITLTATGTDSTPAPYSQLLTCQKD